MSHLCFKTPDRLHLMFESLLTALFIHKQQAQMNTQVHTSTPFEAHQLHLKQLTQLRRNLWVLLWHASFCCTSCWSCPWTNNILRLFGASTSFLHMDAALSGTTCPPSCFSCFTAKSFPQCRWHIKNLSWRAQCRWHIKNLSWRAFRKKCNLELPNCLEHDRTTFKCSHRTCVPMMESRWMVVTCNQPTIHDAAKKGSPLKSIIGFLWHKEALVLCMCQSFLVHRNVCMRACFPLWSLGMENGMNVSRMIVEFMCLHRFSFLLGTHISLNWRGSFIGAVHTRIYRVVDFSR